MSKLLTRLGNKQHDLHFIGKVLLLRGRGENGVER